MTPDDVLAELLHIRTQLDSVDPESPEYAALDARRHELKSLARQASDQARDRASLAAELAHLENRLREIDDYKVDTPEWQKSVGKYSINDPGAAMAKINETIVENHKDERVAIEFRIAQLTRILAE